MNHHGRFGKQFRRLFIDLAEAGYELKIVHRPFGLQHTLGNRIDLAGDEIRILSIDGQFSQGHLVRAHEELDADDK